MLACGRAILCMHLASHAQRPTDCSLVHIPLQDGTGRGRLVPCRARCAFSCEFRAEKRPYLHLHGGRDVHLPPARLRAVHGHGRAPRVVGPRRLWNEEPKKGDPQFRGGAQCRHHRLWGRQFQQTVCPALLVCIPMPHCPHPLVRIPMPCTPPPPPPSSTPTQRVGNQPPLSTAGGLPSQKANMYVHTALPTGIRVQL